jgi:hypothetical protein
MPYTMEDFMREYVQDRLDKLSPGDRQKVLQRIPPEERLEGLSPEEIEKYLAARKAKKARKRKRKG